MYTKMRNEIDNVIKLIVENDDNITEEMCKMEIKNYLCYLSLADSIICQEEVDFLETYLDVKTDIRNMNKYIRENEIYTKDFANHIPKMIISAKKTNQDLAMKVIELFKQIGLEFIACDDNVDTYEVDTLLSYYTVLISYVTARI